MSYVKESDTQKLLIVVNSKNKPVETTLSENKNISKTLMSYGVEVSDLKLSIAPYGYIIAQI